MRGSAKSCADADPREAALRLLARREHSRLELFRKLTERGFDAQQCEGVVEALVGEGLLSDMRFAEAYVHARAARGYGPERIRAELGERGVDRELAAASVAAHDPVWIERALLARRKRFGAAAPREYRDRARQIQFLRYRGFTPIQVRAVLDEED